tara:strand:- start:313 stop:657 length:345 start_codon:yes stop_codon:yes gene_type:complete
MKRNTNKSWEYLTEIATSDEGMTISNASIFHSYNPCGLLSKLPTWEDFECRDTGMTNGLALSYTKSSNYYAKEIVKDCGRRCSKIMHKIHLEGLNEDIESAWEHIKKYNLKGAA